MWRWNCCACTATRGAWRRADPVLRLLILVLLLAAAGALLFVRLAPGRAADWHRDPLLAERPGTPNHHLIRPAGGDGVAPIYAMTPAELAAALDRIARADGARLLAGDVEEGHMTYISRSPAFGFPDYTSLRVVPAGTGATFAALARARFGRSDMGVNRARLKRWMAALPDDDAAPQPQ